MSDAERAAIASRALRDTCIAFVLCSVGVYAVAALPDGERGGAYIALHLLLGGLMLVAAWHARDADAASLRWVVMAGAVAAVLVAPAATFTTHDLQRYLWDGRVFLQGHDPYRVAPNDPAVAWLFATWPTPTEHAAYPTLYPPLALALFAFAALFGPTGGLWVWQVLVTAAAVAIIWMAAEQARRLGLERHLAWLALNPLLLLEVGVGAHLDIFAALAVLLALGAWHRGHTTRVGLLLGIGALIKLTPALAVFPLLFACRRRRDAVRLAMGAALALAAGYGSVWLLGLRPWGSTGDFFMFWRFGSPTGWLLDAIAIEGDLLLGIFLGLGGLGLAGLWARRGRVMSATALALALPLLLSPVSFPWYLLVLVPLLPLVPSPPLIAWMLAAPLTYEVLDRFDRTGFWTPADWPLLIIALAWLVGLLIAARARLLRRRQVG